MVGTLTGSITITMDHRINDRNYVNVANAALGAPFDYIINRAVSGTSSTQMLATWNRDVPRFRPKGVLIQSFTNDFRTLTAANAASVLALAKQNAITALGRCETIGAKAIFGTVPTGSDATWTGVAERVPYALLFNEWLRRFCTANEARGAYLYDLWGAVNDPVSTTGVYRTSPAAHTNDNIHPNGFGAFKVAAPLITTLQQAFRFTPAGARCPPLTRWRSLRTSTS